MNLKLITRRLVRLVWNRRMAWTLVCVVSLLTLYYQWENRRSARELVEARAQLIARIGTDDPLAFSPPKIRDDENYFAIPVIEQWATEPIGAPGNFKAYKIPEEAFWPKNLPKPELIENEVERTTRVDWAKWAANRDLKGETAAVVLNRELGDLGGLLPKLAEGLDLPFSSIKPGRREALEATQGDFAAVAIPNVSSMTTLQNALDLHLRCAAAAGDKAKAQQLAMISLRLFPESMASHGTLVSTLVALAMYEIAFPGLQDALSRPVWEERGLTRLQAQLAKDNDLQYTTRALGEEALFGQHVLIRETARRSQWRTNEGIRSVYPDEWWFYEWSMILGPSGWGDADAANVINYMLLCIGPPTEDAWLTDQDRRREARKLATSVNYIAGIPCPAPRRYLSSIFAPNIGTLNIAAAETLFHRRCLILACELEKHRIAHGSYPATLPVLSGFETNDPARPKHPPGYRLENGGYLLWSTGPDAHDDGGHAGNDWLWRMKRTP